jgi:hypothetical protein
MMRDPDGSTTDLTCYYVWSGPYNAHAPTTFGRAIIMRIEPGTVTMDSQPPVTRCYYVWTTL